MVQAFDDRPRHLRPAPEGGGGGAGPRVPPHNLEAEESLLGSMLLSSDATAAAIEICSADDFYKPAHGSIFAAIVALFERGEPVDAVTVTDELRRSSVLESIGDPALLVSLQANTPSIANAVHYARIVEEHALLRRLVGVAGEIAEIGYSVPEDVTGAVDEAERKVFDLAQRRTTDTIESLKNLLMPSLDRIEELAQRSGRITGVATGYTDLDEILAGLQPASLTIVGARPAMGKALALDTPIPTPAGWTTMGALAVGDEVFDEKGVPCRVTYTSPVFTGHRCYRVRFDDGTSLVADAGHRWLAYDFPAWKSHRSREALAARGGPANPRLARDQSARWRQPRVVTTKEMLDEGVRADGGRRPNWYLPLVAAVDTPEVELPVDPYVLGCWLGDGDVSVPPSELQEVGLLGGAVKHVPERYMRASVKQRLALLQGLMDTDGTVTNGNGTVELCLANRRLLEQAWELACSLGHKPHAIRERRIALPDGRTARAWRFCWTPLDPVFRMARKADRLSATASRRRNGRHTRRAVVAIEEMPTVPTRCIAVSAPSHLFLAGRAMIPTHNTSFALGMLAHVGIVLKRPALLFSLEMGHLELTQRMLASEAKVDAQRMRTGHLHESDWSKVGTAVSRLSEATIFIDDNPNLTVMDIRARARRLKKGEGDLGIVVVDYLQLMTGRARAENRQVEVAEISRGLKILARELECPVVALSQLSRGLEARQDKRPMLSDLRESGSLEQDADVVLFIYREEQYDPETPIDRRGMAEIIVAKHRNGPTGSAHLVFLNQYARFDNMKSV
ncbi:MAG TPA: replicative DNA helicase [Acidimicrobiales bacterium]|nr:replicative DNA helicase [Acidimicrobiales bacterium]